MRIRKFVYLTFVFAIAAGIAITGMSCGTESDNSKQEENTNVKEESNTDMPEDTNNTGKAVDSAEEKPDKKDSVSSASGNSENNLENESTNSNDTDGKGSVTPGRVN